ncbi:hypothetical protein [Mucilaginibacter flavidus]|uniref:hypothetical protein n=1 Tax=Mucilaginibacter flavidus TaxID=2949309 RepID=UPI0020920E8C|nr:hypothetical protein [Mucilaginibacter flavidus]
MKKFLLWVVFTILAIVLLQTFINKNLSSPSTFVDPSKRFENSWRTPNVGQEFTTIAHALVKKSIPCPEIKVRKATDENIYLCACKDENEHWRGYQIFVSSGEALPFNDPTILMPSL